MIENIRGLNFLVTGGAGFIGSNLVQFLLEHDAKKVRVLDNLSTGFYDNLKPFLEHPNFEFIEGDITNIGTCRLAVKDMDYVSHHAALGSVSRSIEDPITTNTVNVSGFLNMLIAVKENKGVKRMVYAASSSTYGDSKILPKKEHTIGNPLSPYAVTKYVNELYTEVFAKTYGTDSIGLRYFNVFGPNQRPCGAYAAVVPLFVKAINEGVAPEIHGDGEQMRDFTYVDNAVQGNLKAFFANKEAANQVYNIACCEQLSVNNLWAHLKSLANSSLNPIYVENRQGDIKNSLADISKAEELLGYLPEVKVKEGLRFTWDWFADKELQLIKLNGEVLK